MLISYFDEKVDVIIDTTGIPQVICKAINKLSGNGRLILVGQPSPGKSIEVLNAINMFDGIGKKIFATQGGQTKPNEDIPRYVKLHEAGLLKIENLITNYFPLKDVNKGFDLLKSGMAGRIMINISDD